MAIPPLIEIILFVFEQVTFVSGAVLMYRTYLRYRFPSHAYMSVAFLLFSISSIGRLITSTIEPGDLAVAEIFWSIMNIFLISGILAVFYSFFYFHHNRLPDVANIASLIGGATILAYANVDWFEVSYDSEMGMFTSSYSPIVNILTLPLISLFIIIFLYPIVTKIRFAKTKRAKMEPASILIVFVLLLTWAAMSGVTVSLAVRISRPFFFAGAWLIWIILTVRNPLNLIYTTQRFEKLLVMTDSGYPVLLYDFEASALEDPSLFSALFAALQTALGDLLKADTSLRSIYYENKVVCIEKRPPISIFGIGDEPDTALEAALRAFANNLLDAHPILKTTDGTIPVLTLDPDLIQSIITESFSSVIF